MSVLKYLEENRVFSIEKINDGEFEFVEGCDKYYCVSLNKEELFQLGVEIMKLALEENEISKV